ncbi:phosphotransferase [Natrinema sp. 74]|uniref:phosphotransferase n=1 Tax=Natrinema sp. 74 TaxID=3384159 RepID=UPI0038D3FF4C
MANLLRSYADVLDGAAALVHHDVRPENVFRNRQSGVIDWEWALVGDPGLRLCWAEE